MRVVIVRHGQALSKQDDPEQGLSPHGREQAKLVGAELKKLDLAEARILHSVKTRARQTAEIIAAELQTSSAPEQIEGIKPNDPVEPIVRDILAADETRIYVSHLPFVQYLTAVLMTHRKEPQPVFSTCGMAVLERDDDSGSFSVVHTFAPA
jgi:phosphohistidine phosphatase